MFLRSTALADTEISEANFPDNAFRNTVKVFDTDGDGILSDAEIAGVKEIDCQFLGIESLKGIEVFTALEDLNCEMNELKKLDLRHNPRLKKLSCGYNTALSSLNLVAQTELRILNSYKTLFLAAGAPETAAFK